jgi:hypothetical protein
MAELHVHPIGNILYIDNIVVHKKYQGLGLGQEMIFKLGFGGKLSKFIPPPLSIIKMTSCPQLLK